MSLEAMMKHSGKLCSASIGLILMGMLTSGARARHGFPGQARN